MATFITKAAAEVEDFTIDWATRGLAAGETVIGSSWAASPPGISIATPSPTFTGATATVWLSGGVLNTAHTVTNTVTTSGGRTFVQSFAVYIYQ